VNNEEKSGEHLNQLKYFRLFRQNLFLASNMVLAFEKQLTVTFLYNFDAMSANLILENGKSSDQHFYLYFYLLLFISTFMSDCLVLSHSLWLVIISGHQIPRMFRRHP
jgi:hypothetical protein